MVPVEYMHRALLQHIPANYAQVSRSVTIRFELPVPSCLQNATINCQLAQL